MILIKWDNYSPNYLMGPNFFYRNPFSISSVTCQNSIQSKHGVYLIVSINHPWYITIHPEFWLSVFFCHLALLATIQIFPCHMFVCQPIILIATPTNTNYVLLSLKAIQIYYSNIFYMFVKYVTHNQYSHMYLCL